MRPEEVAMRSVVPSRLQGELTDSAGNKTEKSLSIIAAPGNLAITPSTLPAGSVGAPYNALGVAPAGYLHTLGRSSPAISGRFFS